MAFDWGGLIGGVGSLLGGGAGLFGATQNNSGNQQTANEIAREQLAFQREAAQNGIRWRVADSQAAGVSPLVGLGAQTFNPSPISYDGGGQPSSNIGASVAAMGQGLGRAISATQTKGEKVQTAMEIAIQQAQLDKMKAETDVSRAQTASIMARLPGAAPPFPSIGRTGLLEGQGNGPAASVSGGSSGGYQNTVPKLTTENPDNAGAVSGPPSPQGTWRTNPNGALVYEDAPGSQPATIGGWTATENWMRNRLLPYLSAGKGAGFTPPPDNLLPYGAVQWIWSSTKGGWIPGTLAMEAREKGR